MLNARQIVYKKLGVRPAKISPSLKKKSALTPQPHRSSGSGGSVVSQPGKAPERLKHINFKIRSDGLAVIPQFIEHQIINLVIPFKDLNAGQNLF